MSEIQLPQIVGNTPLVYLKNVSELTGCRILAKAEFMNPGGSVKDRTALGIIRDAEERGELRPGGVIVEGTAGNTGIGLTIIANALGYKSVVVMPQSQSKEKIASLEMLGADLILVPAVAMTIRSITYQRRKKLQRGVTRENRTVSSGRGNLTISPIARCIMTPPGRRSGNRRVES